MKYRVSVNKQISTEAGEGDNLLEVLRTLGAAPEAPCGGNGRCGKCLAEVNGEKVLACRTVVDRDMEVTLLADRETFVLKDTGMALPAEGLPQQDLLGGSGISEGKAKLCAAFDIGTTTVVCYLLDAESGRILASEGELNPQEAFGADVISRIRADLKEEKEGGRTPRSQTRLIRESLNRLLQRAAADAEQQPADVGRIVIVGNPAMQQLFAGVSLKNLAEIPFAPHFTKCLSETAAEAFPDCPEAELWTLPDISGYVGADTVGCVIASGMDKTDKNILLVDIGTNGEMVLSAKGRMAACSTAAGPALEGAGIRCGMRGAAGAVDHVRLSAEGFSCHVIGDGPAAGICGSGLIDAVACALDAGLINKRGRITKEAAAGVERYFCLNENLQLCQSDIRAFQLAKGAICAGAQLLCRELGIKEEELDEVLLAGAFGSFLDPVSALRTGLLPDISPEKIRAIGNAAGAGAIRLALGQTPPEECDRLAARIRFVELASLPDFNRVFGKCTGFD